MKHCIVLIISGHSTSGKKHWIPPELQLAGELSFPHASALNGAGQCFVLSKMYYEVPGLLEVSVNGFIV